MYPLIGIFSCFREQGRQTVPEAYIRAVALAGGCPVLLPAPPSVFPSFRRSGKAPGVSVFSPAPWLSFCQGFLFPGGNDITPLLQDEPPLPGIGTVDVSFDIFQIQAAEQILARGKPVLGICRGMQVLNAARGGALYQDLSCRREPSWLHMQTSLDRGDPCHLVETAPGTLTASLLGEKLFTNSFHHQAVCTPGTGVCISARTGDGVAEALEIPEHPFALGVQWHPEAMLSTAPVMKQLFRALVETAGTVCE